MPIQKGEDWGSLGPLPEGSPIVDSDRELGRVVESAITDGTTLGPVGLLGGDLWRTLGGRQPAEQDRALAVDHLGSAAAVCAPIDVWRAETAGHVYRFVAHLVLRRRLWAGQCLVAMNTSWCGPRYLGPRAHPGDGLIDVTTGALGLRQRYLANQLAASGSHLPHPALTTVRKSSFAQRTDPGRRGLAGALQLVVDGEVVGRAGANLHISLEPVTLTVVV